MSNVIFHIFFLFSVINVSYSLICYECNSSDENCTLTPVYTKSCDAFVDLCFTFRENDKLFYRGCADPADKIWLACIEKNYTGCSYCRDDYCNVQRLSFTRRTIFCVTSKEPSYNLKDIVPLRCEGSIPIGAIDYCYYYMSKNPKGEYDVTDRGCYPYKGQVKSDSALFYCHSNGCNSYITHSTYMFCFSSAGLNRTTGREEICQNPSTNFPALCFSKPGEQGAKWNAGCLSKMKSFAEVQACSFSYAATAKKVTCQTCDRRYCLKEYPATKKNYANKCMTLTGSRICSQYTAQCYVHLTNYLVTAAGCVEPGLSHEITTHMNTLFCSNEKSNYTSGCFNPKWNYSDTIGCYDCQHCPHPEKLTSIHKKMCHGEAPSCYTYTTKLEKLVVRGCVGSRAYFNCSSDSTCYICNTNYCNGNRFIRNPLKCYTSKPFGYDHHSTTLQLESCNGLYPMVRDDKCYMAQHKKTMAIGAGCIEDAPKENSVYEEWMSGSTSLIFDGIRSVCYKCKSTKPDHCFNVARLKAEPCSGNGQYAVRGCYTYFSRYETIKIQRGCMSELDPYLQSLCLMPHFEELCITCTESGCNSHHRYGK